MRRLLALLVALAALAAGCSTGSDPDSGAARDSTRDRPDAATPPPTLATGTPMSKDAYEQRVCQLRKQHLQGETDEPIDTRLMSKDDSVVADGLRAMATEVSANLRAFAEDLADIVPPPDVRAEHERYVEVTWSARRSFDRAATKLSDEQLVREPDPMQRQKWEDDLHATWDDYEAKGYPDIAGPC